MYANKIFIVKFKFWQTKNMIATVIAIRLVYPSRVLTMVIIRKFSCDEGKQNGVKIFMKLHKM